MERIDEIQQRHNGWIDALVANFERELQCVVASAQARTLAVLRENLKVENGNIRRTAGNAKTLRQLDTIFLQQLDRAGYQHLLNEFTGRFPGQLPFFQETLEAIGQGPVKFSARDLQVFADQGVSVKDGLDAVAESVASEAKRRILLSVGGLPFADLSESLAGYLQRTVKDASGLAETAVATYYRMIADRGYQLIQSDLPSEVLRYRFYGPWDRLTRPFCKHLLQGGKSYTRDEVDGMDNGQIPNVFITGGGFRCRHQWLIAPDEAPPKPKVKAGSEIRKDLLEKADTHAAAISALEEERRQLLGQPSTLGKRIKLGEQIEQMKAETLDVHRAVLYQANPATPAVKYSKTLPAAWRSGVEAFSKLIGSGLADDKAIAFKATTAKREYYSPSGKLVTARKNSKTMTIVHELGHWLEDVVPAVAAKAQAFLVRRTTTDGKRDPLIKLRTLTGIAYGPKEVARPDKFENAYVGKDYSSGGRVYATEVMSMGLENLYERPVDFARKDPDFFDFVLDTVRGR